MTRQQKESVSRFTCQIWGYWLAFFVTLRNLWFLITRPVGINESWNYCYSLAKYVFLPISSAGPRKSATETHLPYNDLLLLKTKVQLLHHTYLMPPILWHNKSMDKEKIEAMATKFSEKFAIIMLKKHI